MNRPTDTRTRPKLTGSGDALARRGDEPVPAPLDQDAYERSLLKDQDFEEATFERISSILGSAERGGDWVVSDEIAAVTRLGDITLDFTHADLPPGREIEIDCDAILGAITLIVPSGAEVELESVHAIIGGIKQVEEQTGVVPFFRKLLNGDDPRPQRREDAAELLFVVRGRVICGDITVVTR